MPRTQAESDFIDQFTRTLLVQWARYCVDHEGAPLPSGNFPDAKAAQANLGLLATDYSALSVYALHAQEKGWLSKKEPLTVLAKGFSTAAAFLKR